MSHHGKGKPYGRNRNNYQGRNRGGYENNNYKKSFNNYSDFEPKSLRNSLILLILRVGDKMQSTLETNLETLTKILINDYFEHKDAIISTLTTCVSELPHKTSIYGTLVALVFLKDKDIGTEIINSCFYNLVKSIENGELRSAKIWLRFIGALVNTTAVSAQSLLSIYDTLINKINEVKIKDIADSLLYLILGSLPWSGRTLSNTSSEALDSIIDRIGDFMTLRLEIVDPRVNLFKTFHNASEDIQLDDLELLWIQTKDLQANEWELPELLKPYLKFDQFATTEQLSLPEFVFPEKYSVDNLPLPKQTFCLFPEHHEIFKTASYYIISDVINDLIDIFNINRREGVKVLFELRESYAINTFLRLPSDHPEAKQSQPKADGDEEPAKKPENGEAESGKKEVEKEPELMEEGEEATPEKQHNLVKFIIECLVRKMLELPKPPNKAAYYGALAIEIVKTHEEDSTEFFNEAFTLLFEQCNDMDIECIDRFYNFLSRHISNFAFTFNWENWSVVLEADKLTNQRILVTETLEKLIRLSYFERIKNTLSDDFKPLLPTISDKPVFSFMEFGEGNSENEIRRFVDEFKKALKDRVNTDELYELLVSASTDPGLGEVAATKAVIEIILLMGKKSFSHLMNAVERCLPLLKLISAEDSNRQLIVTTVCEFWQVNPQWMTICLDKLLSYHVIDPVTIVKILFTSTHEDQYHRSYIWEILYGTMTKAEIWVTQQRTEYETFVATSKFSAKPTGTEDELLSTLNHAISDFKLALFEAYQGFSNVLQKRLDELKQDSIPENEDLKYSILSNRMKEFARRFASPTTENITSLEVVVFTEMTDERIMEIFQTVKALKISPSLEVSN